MMARTPVYTKALDLLLAFERAGKPVSSVIVDGHKVELVLTQPVTQDEFDRIDMRHDKT